jgi:enamine deaminase RidA (YjgF/YER057c/UK114 family)
MYITSGQLGRWEGGELLKLREGQRVGGEITYERAREEVLKAVLNGICSVGHGRPEVLDQIQAGEVTLFAQTTDQALAQRLAGDATDILQDIFGGTFAVRPDHVSGVKVNGLPLGVAVEPSFVLYVSPRTDDKTPIMIEQTLRTRFGVNLEAWRIGRDRYLVEGIEPRKADGTLLSSVYFDDETIEEGQKQARLACDNFLELVKDELGLNPSRIVSMHGAVRSRVGFGGQPQIINGASEQVSTEFPGVGLPARAATGMTDEQLERDASVVLSVMFEVS